MLWKILPRRRFLFGTKATDFSEHQKFKLMERIKWREPLVTLRRERKRRKRRQYSTNINNLDFFIIFEITILQYDLLLDCRPEPSRQVQKLNSSAESCPSVKEDFLIIWKYGFYERNSIDLQSVKLPWVFTVVRHEGGVHQWKHNDD